MMGSEAFIVDHPDGYDEKDVEVFRASVKEALVAIAKDAHMDVMFDRTWNRTMVDLKLGEEGNPE